MTRGLILGLLAVIVVFIVVRFIRRQR